MATRYQNPALTVDGILVRRGRVLLVRRARPPFAGLWALPGGFVELRETVEEALSRELREETGLRGTAGELVGVYSGPDRDPRKPTTTVAFLIRRGQGRLKGGDDAAEAAWVPLPEVGRLAFDHNEILKDALRLVGRRRLRLDHPRNRGRRLRN